MRMLSFLLLVVLVTVPTVYGQSTTVVADCNVNPATKSIEFTITGNLANGNPPNYVTIQGCVVQKAITAGVATFSTDAGGDCPGANTWGTTFVITVQEFINLQLDNSDSFGVLCDFDTSSLTPSVAVSVSHGPTDATIVNFVTPTATLFIADDAACTTPTASIPYLIVGQSIVVCVQLDAAFDLFDAKVKTLTATSAGTSIDIVADGCGSTTYTFVPDPAGQSQGLISTGPFPAFRFTNNVLTQDSIVISALVEVCDATTGAFCNLYACGGAGRKKRDVSNDTAIVEQLELSTTIRVAGSPEDFGRDQDQREQAATVSDNDVCIQKGGFYGLIIFFVLALSATVLASCFLFMRARKSRKYIDERYLHSEGSHNPSYRG